MPQPRYTIADLPAIAPVPCPCGQARRAFADLPSAVASVHLVDIQANAKVHYHKKMTEIYVILEGVGHLELDGQLIPVHPLMTIMIHPLCRHRALGRLRILNIPIPAFDERDEWFD